MDVFSSQCLNTQSLEASVIEILKKFSNILLDWPGTWALFLIFWGKKSLLIVFDESAILYTPVKSNAFFFKWKACCGCNQKIMFNQWELRIFFTLVDNTMLLLPSVPRPCPLHFFGHPCLLNICY